MRTLFVNPSRGGGRRRGRGRRRRNPYILSNPSRRRYRRNPLPSLPNLVRDTAFIAAGGAALNRVGLSHITNFYLRNGARVLAAAALSAYSRTPLAIAAAGATLAPIMPEVEMQLAAVTANKNPHELAAELASMLEADLSGDLDELSDELEEEISW